MMMKKISKLGRWLLVGFCVCLLSLGTGVARAAAPFYWDFIHTDIVLEPDGDLLVTETQKYIFTSAHTNQRYRYIPMDRLDQITDVAVYEDGDRLSAQTGTKNNNYWIRWQHPLDPPESHTFVIQYRVVGAVQRQGDRSQIYWRGLFPDRSAPIEQGRITVHLPDALTDTVIGFEGLGAASRDRQIDGTTFEVVAQQSLEPQQFLDVKLQFPNEILALEQPQWQQDLDAQGESVSDTPVTVSSSGIQGETTAQADQGYSPDTNPDVSSDLGLLGILGILAAVGAIVSVVCLVTRAVRRCPRCNELTLQRSSRISRSATVSRQGIRKISHRCNNCGYHKTFTKVIPKKSATHYGGASIGAGGAGCGGGGGGGAGGGGGGGGCGGAGGGGGGG